MSFFPVAWGFSQSGPDRNVVLELYEFNSHRIEYPSRIIQILSGRCNMRMESPAEDIPYCLNHDLELTCKASRPAMTSYCQLLYGR